MAMLMLGMSSFLLILEEQFEQGQGVEEETATASMIVEHPMHFQRSTWVKQKGVDPIVVDAEYRAPQRFERAP
jgi:hypothetical protein